MHKLFRSSVASMAICAVFVLAACSGGGTGGSDGGTTSTPGAIEVEEGLLTVDLRIDRSLLDPDGALTNEAIVSAASEKGLSATIDGDTVVYTMTKQQRDQMLADMRSSTQKTIDNLIADESNSITGVELDNAETSFSVSVDAARYSQFESLLALGFYVSGALYQQFAGVSSDDVDVTVEFVDDTTGEVLNTGSYKDMLENLAE